jgi:hypothetical protein
MQITRICAKNDSLPYKYYKKRIYNIFKTLIYSFSSTNRSGRVMSNEL